MRAVVQSPFAEDVAASPRRGNQKSKQHQPVLRLISSESHASVGTLVPRLAAIVAADMVDYTRHMASDEAGTHARCTALRRTVVEPGLARHDARVIKHTGDGFLAEFSSATQAVWFAVKFQEVVRAWNARRARARRLEFRVGVNLGDVIAEAHDVFGHSVNVASRLESAARPGGVLVSHAVFVSVRDPRLQFEDAGDLSLKNVDEPVRGFHARASKPARLRRPVGGARLAAA
jgi:class 3 adenylate cyclase